MKYLTIYKAELLTILAYQKNVILTSLTNLAYIFVIYSLWKSIYDNGHGIVNTTFDQLFIYLALALTFSNVYRTWLEWDVSNKILSGNIVREIIHPLILELKYFVQCLATSTFNLIIIGLPIVVFLMFFTSVKFNFNFLDVFYIFISLLLAYVINYLIDLITASIAFYTQSIWGVSLAKESLVALASGVIIPLSFFSDSAMQLILCTPFPFVFYFPLAHLTGMQSMFSIVDIILHQLFWIALMGPLSIYFFRRSICKVTINGG